MIKINLLPKELQEKGKGVEYVVLGGALIGLIALTGSGIYLTQYFGYKKDLEKKSRWEKQLAEVKAKVSQVEALDSQKSLLQAKKGAVTQLFHGRLLYPKMMELFYSTLPRDVWVTELKLTEDANRNIAIVADSNSLSTEGIAQWLESLESQSQFFSGVTLSAIESEQAEGSKQAPVYKFTMSFTCTVPQTGS